MELEGIRHGVVTLNILINCLCGLGVLSFGFSTLGKMFKLAIEPDVITFNTLINGLCVQGKFAESVTVFNEMVRDGYQPDSGTVGKTAEAIQLLKKIEQGGFQPNAVVCNTVIGSLSAFARIGSSLRHSTSLK
ncbi:hypothetical protein SLEP1_g36969 [Rubroshorea leprosula]|uniref:Pentatricopeptide repeat-containing protein n=1 Tax=Rubroshorea leprosula TaxID=152421 RepID=A0AAV5KT73_9ROSI|nr:hypothetical protein SLEP1_g36969 [Rubroshorea leprosula]